MEGSNNITITLAFVAGLASFLSPCVLPLVPGYISLISGVSIDHLKGEGGSSGGAKRAVIVNSLAFNAGLSLIFVALGTAAGLVGATVLSNNWVRWIGGGVIILFGLQLIGLLKIGALYRDTRKFSDERPRGAFGSLALGMAFAAGWTPCIGPILGGIIGLAATSGGWKSGLVLSSFYSAGLAVPFLVTGLLLNKFLGFYTWFRQHLHKVEVVSGVMLILIGLLIASNNLTWIASVGARWMPNLEASLQRANSQRNETAAEQAAAKIADDKLEKTVGAPASNNATGGGAPTAGRSALTPAPDVELKTLDGAEFRLSELRGQVVLLNFWATWCIPCRSEIPVLNALNRELEGRGFRVVGVSTYDTADVVKDYQKDIKQDYRVVLGADDAQAKYSVAALPTTFIIDREGRIRQTIIGERTRDAFEAAILPLLDEQAASNK